MFSSGWLLLLVSVTSHALVVHIPGLGDVEGVKTNTAWTSRTIEEFRGIRFAQAPSGDRRFKDPVKVEAWTGVYNATIYGQACPQPNLFGNDARLRRINQWIETNPEVMHMQREATSRSDDPEDCLTLNVFTPRVDPEIKLPVLVYFHGGAFLYGSAGNHKPIYILENDIVLVTPQYRLGALGFFHLNTGEAPGNMALSDQLMALQWVQDNIEVFGGDPARVTIGGISAGAGSVGLHMISPRSAGMFHQVIAQSGSNLDIWALDVKDGEFHSRNVATTAGCDGSASSSELTTCLRLKTVDEIVNAQLMYTLAEWKKGNLGMGGAMPTLQREMSGVTPFIKEIPRVTMETGNYNHVPLIMGASRHEGIYFLDFSYQFYVIPNNYLNDRDFLRYDFVSMLPKMFGIEDISRVLEDACIKRYFNEDDLGNFTAMTPGLVDMYGAMMIKSAALRQTELHSSRAKSFLYTFDYYGEQSLTNNGEGTLPVPGGITHGDDTMYLFPRSPKPLNKKDTLVAQRMVEMFTNFIITGEPTTSTGIPWPQFNVTEGKYLSISDTNVGMSDFEGSYSVAREHGLTSDTPPTSMWQRFYNVVKTHHSSLFHWHN